MEEIGIKIQPAKSNEKLNRNEILDELEDEDPYTQYKKLQRHLEFLKLQEDYIKDEHKNLKTELIRAQEEVKRIQSVPLVIGQFLEPIDQYWNCRFNHWF